MSLEQNAIERIKTASEMSMQYYDKPLICTYSGGKDSDVMLHLFKSAGIPFEVSHSLVTVDAPQTVKHVKDVFRDLELSGVKTTIDYHEDETGKRTTMWNLIPRKLMPPTRIVRYCCKSMKESNKYTRHRMIATGVRWDESTKRKSRDAYEVVNDKKEKRVNVSDEKMLLSDQDEDARRLFEQCNLKASTIVNPIIDWKEKDIWDYIHENKIATNPLYECGYKRVGCVGCPMAGRKQREREFHDFPKYKEAYIRAFDRMLEERKRKELQTVKWKSGDEVFHWWIEDENIFGQMNIFDFIED